MSANSIDSAQYVDGSIDVAHMSANSIDSAQYVDGSIDTVHIADNQVTLAKMAGIARGKIIYGDSSGDPAVLTVGSSGQVLNSDGTDISWGTSVAATLTTGRTIGMTGDVVWTSPSFNGSGNVTAAATIQANAVEGSMLNTDVISGQTALTSGLAETDELLVSDGGTIKRMDMSVLLALTDANAAALAIALG
jgi:hypothetical protein